MALDVPSSSQATVLLENKSTGRSFHTAVNLTTPLCLSSAEWVLERAYSLSGLIGLVDFGTETFSNISYSVAGEKHTTLPEDVTILDIIDDEANNVTQTSTEIVGDAVKVTYLGS